MQTPATSRRRADDAEDADDRTRANALVVRSLLLVGSGVRGLYTLTFLALLASLAF
ncbi:MULTISPECIES: hypothetical protein [Halorussus]|uniref:hypothetical protein n=1 Tax=Halorussus TaxID=1070314 RepID=UPI0020A17F38|nr:hypothetical protein [Halorussus vallis]USZ78175.1 hypothetical protein NGM07_21195 [Halorussus vallis]